MAEVQHNCSEGKEILAKTAFKKDDVRIFRKSPFHAVQHPVMMVGGDGKPNVTVGVSYCPFCGADLRKQF